MKCLSFLLAACAMMASLDAQSPMPMAAPTRPIAHVAHVVIISIDGLRPDRLLPRDGELATAK